MRITALSRGGLATFGGLYDPHRNEVVIDVRDCETDLVIVEFPTAPTTVTVSGTGATVTNLTISGNTASLNLSGFNGGGYIDLLATLGSEIRKIRIRGKIGDRLFYDYGSAFSVSVSDGSTGELDFSESNNSDLIGV